VSGRVDVSPLGDSNLSASTSQTPRTISGKAFRATEEEIETGWLGAVLGGHRLVVLRAAALLVQHETPGVWGKNRENVSWLTETLKNQL
jgi:hypothetical protein